MSRREQREGFNHGTRITLLETDMDQLEADHKEDQEATDAKMTWSSRFVIGVLMSTTSGSLYVAFKAIAENGGD